MLSRAAVPLEPLLLEYAFWIKHLLHEKLLHMMTCKCIIVCEGRFDLYARTNCVRACVPACHAHARIRVGVGVGDGCYFFEYQHLDDGMASPPHAAHQVSI